MGQLARGAEAGPAALAAQDRWQEMYWSENGRTAGRGRSGRFEQAELWNDTPARVAEPAPAAAVAPAARVAASPASRAPATSRSITHRSTARRTTVGVTYAERRREVRTDVIARYLQVNNAVYGRLVPVQDLALPRQSFNAELQLWKGREIGTPFVTGC